jgi:hypothetical protein
MTPKTGVGRKLLARCLAVVAMVGLYCLATLSVSGVVLSTTSTPAEAQRGRGRGRGGPGGGYRGRGRGVVVRGRGRGRGRGIWRGGIWYPWFAPGICVHPWTGVRVPCPFW